MNLTDKELKELFHTLWGESKDGVYDKQKWNTLRNALVARKIDL